MIDIVISLTTWKGRIFSDSFNYILHRLLDEQITNYKYKVVLVLSEEEFGKDFVLPSNLAKASKRDDFEILWTYKNTKALKKLNPTMQKYSNVPIITLDDDILVSKTLVQTCMNTHLEKPNSILGTHVFESHGVKIACGIRCYPPNSLIDLSDELFEKYFHNLQDDEFNGIRAKLKHTEIEAMSQNIIEDLSYGNQEVAMSKIHLKYPPDLDGLYKDHPELK